MVSALTVAIGLAYCFSGSCEVMRRRPHEAESPWSLRAVNELALGVTHLAMGLLSLVTGH